MDGVNRNENRHFVGNHKVVEWFQLVAGGTFRQGALAFQEGEHRVKPGGLGDYGSEVGKLVDYALVRKFGTALVAPDGGADFLTEALLD